MASIDGAWRHCGMAAATRTIANAAQFRNRHRARGQLATAHRICQALEFAIGIAPASGLRSLTRIQGMRRMLHGMLRLPG
jgi:hypothetical protein